MAEPVKPWWSEEFANVSGIALKGLVYLFVFAVLVESALAVIFNWRLFLEVFNGRGMRTLVAIAVSALVVKFSGINVLDQLAATMNGTAPPVKEATGVSFWLTALILAGGGSGVNRILVALGYRTEVSQAETKVKPEEKRAWVSIRVIRDKAEGPIKFNVTPKGAVTAASPAALTAVVNSPDQDGVWRRIVQVFLLDRTRMPPRSGWQVDSLQEYEILVEAKDAAQQPIACPINGTYRFAGGAIIDFVVKL